jgi:hypothetical protein
LSASDAEWTPPVMAMSAPAASPSFCISTTCGTVPYRLGRRSEAHWSAHSPIGDEGVMG